MEHNTPKKVSQEWLEHLKNNYTYDREKGQVFNNKTGKPSLAPNNHGYLHVKLKRFGRQKTLKAHHVVWFFEYGKWPKSCIDHIDGNKLNNYHTNLREVTSRENAQFYRRSMKTTSKYLGVSWGKCNKKWRTQIKIDSKSKHLGYFDCELEAARAYDKALVSMNLDPVNVKIMRHKEKMQKVMEFMNDTD